MRIQQAIIEFLANELHLEASAITAETSFAELGLDATQQAELLQRLQEALGIILPEEKATPITTVGDLLEATDDQDTAE